MKILKKIIDMVCKTNKDEINKYNIQDLLPETIDDNKMKSFNEIFDYAMNNDKIKDIAVTGPYSSGKSTLVNSYVKNKKLKKKHVCRVSILKKDENVINGEIEEIEKNIIEQMYYSKAIYINRKQILKALAISLFITLVGLIFIMSNNIYFHNIIYIVFVSNIILTFLINMLFNIKLLSVKLDNIEIKIDENNKESNIFNEQLGLLINIFEELEYRYVIIEDLDRMNNPKIFEHLKQLNYILNENFRYTIKFIYLIKDDIFKENNRTKFFDIIIPVVPVLSKGNSADKFWNIIKEDKLCYDLDKNYIYDVCLYIWDFRILKNAFNEFKRYMEDLNKLEINSKELFAMMLYKNQYSEDFANLEKQENKSILELFFKQKQNFVNLKIEQCNKDIKTKKDEINNIENSILSENDFKDLLRIPIGNNTIMFRIDNQIKNILLVNLNDLKNEKIEISISGNQYSNFYNYLDNSHKVLKSILMKIIKKSEDKSSILKKEINDKEMENSNLLNSNLKDIINKCSNEEINDIIKYNDFSCERYQLLLYLLKKGYINENYYENISKFHNGMMEQIENNFIISVHNDIFKDFNIQLKNNDVIINRLSIEDFCKESILNISLLIALIKDEINNKDKLDNYIESLIKSNRLIEFMRQFDKQEISVKSRLYELIVNRKYFWNYLSQNIVPEIDNVLISNILVSSNIEHIMNQENKDSLVKYIELNGIFLNEEINENDLEKVKNIIKLLNIKYKKIDIGERVNMLIKNYCIDNNNYEINYENMNFIIKIKFNNTNINNNYSALKQYPVIINYINDNIVLYLKEVYLKEDVNKETNNIYSNYENDIIDFINNPDIEEDIKVNIIKLEKNKIINIEKIEDNNIWDYLLEGNKVKCTWNNIKKYYNKNSVNNSLIQYINRNYKEIENIIDNNSLGMILDIINNENLIDDSYIYIFEILRNSKINIINVEELLLTENRLIKLISMNIIPYSIDIYNKLLEKNLSNVNIVYMKHYNRKIVNDIIRVNYSCENIIEILTIQDNKKVNLSKIKKEILLNIQQYSIEEYSNVQADIMSEMFLKYDIKNNEYKKFFNSISNEELKVRILNLNIENIEKCDIKIYLRMISEKYEKILIYKCSPQILNTDYNNELINNIIKKGFNIDSYIIGEDSKYIKIKGTNKDK